MRSFTEKKSLTQGQASSIVARYPAASGPGSEDHILTLQRTIGNQAVQRMLRPPVQRACACGGKCPKCQKKQTGQGDELSAAESGAVQRTPDSEATPEESVTPDPEMEAILAAIAAIPVKKSSRDGDTEDDYKKLVKEGKYCRDDEKTGALHPGQQCYRQIPQGSGYPGGKQACFSKRTGEFVEDSPDYVSAVSGQKADGTCDIPMGLGIPWSLVKGVFTGERDGVRALGHFAGDIATEDAHLVGLGFGALAGVSMGIALPKDGLDSGLGHVLVPAILSFLAGGLASGGLRSLKEVTRKHGFLPYVSLGGGLSVNSDDGLSLTGGGAKLGVGYEKRNRPLPLVPINSYLTLGMDSNLNFGDGLSSTFLAKVGVRIDPGKQGGVFALGSLGAGLSAGSGLSGVTSREVGVGYRANEFLDVQIVREEVSGGDRDPTYLLTLKLTAPRAALKEHVKEPRPGE